MVVYYVWQFLGSHQTSHKEARISSNEMDETGADYTAWSKPERKTPIQYTNTYIWNLERWQQWPYMQDSKRDTDIKNTLLDSVGEAEGGMIWENSIETCILPYVKQRTRASLMHKAGHPNPEGWDGEAGERGFRMGGTHVYLWPVHVDVWQNHHNIVISLQLK